METHVILIFDCCRGRESIEMSAPVKPPPTFQVNTPQVLDTFICSFHIQLSVKPSRLGDLKNADLKNSYTFHATLPNQVDPDQNSKF